MCTIIHEVPLPDRTKRMRIAPILVSGEVGPLERPAEQLSDGGFYGYKRHAFGLAKLPLKPMHPTLLEKKPNVAIRKRGARMDRAPRRSAVSRASSRNSSTSRGRFRRARRSAVRRAFSATESQEAFHRALPAPCHPPDAARSRFRQLACKYPRGTTST